MPIIPQHNPSKAKGCLDPLHNSYATPNDTPDGGIPQAEHAETAESDPAETAESGEQLPKAKAHGSVIGSKQGYITTC